MTTHVAHAQLTLGSAGPNLTQVGAVHSSSFFRPPALALLTLPNSMRSPQSLTRFPPSKVSSPTQRSGPRLAAIKPLKGGMLHIRTGVSRLRSPWPDANLNRNRLDPLLRKRKVSRAWPDGCHALRACGFPWSPIMHTIGLLGPVGVMCSRLRSPMVSDHEHNWGQWGRVGVTCFGPVVFHGLRS